MGCFWSPDALFGSLGGVVRTRVGYAGGSTENPTYRNLGDHIETVQVDYDPGKISFQDLVHMFFNNHKPIAEPWKRQYMSAIFFNDEKERSLFQQNREMVSQQLNRKVFTEAIPYHTFYRAEDRHQKYKLQRQPGLMKELRDLYPKFDDLINSTAAARLNGWLSGYGYSQSLWEAIDYLCLSPESQQLLLNSAKGLTPSCSG